MKLIKFFITLIISLVLFSSCGKSDFFYDVDVTYQYENEPDKQYTISFQDNHYFTARVKTVDVSYSVPAGYINRLIVIRSISVNSERMHPWCTTELMFVPDRKFKVIDITYRGGKVEK